MWECQAVSCFKICLCQNSTSILWTTFLFIEFQLEFMYKRLRLVGCFKTLVRSTDNTTGYVKSNSLWTVNLKAILENEHDWWQERWHSKSAVPNVHILEPLGVLYASNNMKKKGAQMSQTNYRVLNTDIARLVEIQFCKMCWWTLLNWIMKNENLSHYIFECNQHLA